MSAPENGMMGFTIFNLADLKRAIGGNAERYGFSLDDVTFIGIEVEPKRIYRIRLCLEDPDVILGRQLLTN